MSEPSEIKHAKDRTAFSREVGAKAARSMTVGKEVPLRYFYNAVDQLTAICKESPCLLPLVPIVYDNVGRREHVGLPDNIYAFYQYDAASRLTSIQFRNGDGGALIGALTYEYDAAGRRRKVGDIDTGWARVSLPAEFDIGVVDADRINYTIILSPPADTYTSYLFDSNGRLRSDGQNTYTWDSGDQLVAIKGPGGNLLASFTYDALGRRIRKRVNGAQVKILYDGANPVWESSLQGTTDLLTGLEIDEYFARTHTDRTHTVSTQSFLTDALGSTVALADESGTITMNYTYEPFGTATSDTGSPNEFQFTGRENDGTGLYYYRARYYSPTLQRFISEDPIGFAGGDTNLYGYVRNDPVNATLCHEERAESSQRDAIGLSDLLERGDQVGAQRGPVLFSNQAQKVTEGTRLGKIDDVLAALKELCAPQEVKFDEIQPLFHERADDFARREVPIHHCKCRWVERFHVRRAAKHRGTHRRRRARPIELIG